jgi:hypothetical protein
MCFPGPCCRVSDIDRSSKTHTESQGLLRTTAIAFEETKTTTSEIPHEELLLAVAQPPPHRAEYIGIVVGPDPLVLVGLGLRPLF